MNERIAPAAFATGIVGVTAWLAGAEAPKLFGRVVLPPARIAGFAALGTLSYTVVEGALSNMRGFENVKGQRGEYESNYARHAVAIVAATGLGAVAAAISDDSASTGASVAAGSVLVHLISKAIIQALTADDVAHN